MVKGAKSGSKENSLFSRIAELGLFPFFKYVTEKLGGTYEIMRFAFGNMHYML